MKKPSRKQPSMTKAKAMLIVRAHLEDYFSNFVVHAPSMSRHRLASECLNLGGNIAHAYLKLFP